MLKGLNVYYNCDIISPSKVQVSYILFKIREFNYEKDKVFNFRKTGIYSNKKKRKISVKKGRYKKRITN